MKDFSPIVNPNLPTDKVRHIVASGEYTQYINELNNCGISVLTTQICNEILPAVRSHADMVFAYLGNARYIIEKSQKNLKKELDNIGLFTEFDDVSLCNNYPDDIKLNSCIICDKILTGKKNTFDLCSDKYKVIKVPQGYAKCSVCVINENSIITDDESIYNACIAYDMDVLLIRKGSVQLNGFDYGFIGGCCGKISADTIAFCGDITTHADYAKIKSFLSERNIFALSLGRGKLTDIGSLLPITQQI